MSITQLIIEPIPGGITGNFAYDLLKHILNYVDEQKSFIDRISKSNYRTGIRLATEGFSLPIDNPEQKQFFLAVLRFDE